MDTLKKHIYIAGPYTAETEVNLYKNIEKAEQAAAEIFHIGHIPIVPHITGFSLSCDEKHADHPHEHWMQNLCLPLLSKCDAIYMLKDWQNSKGALIEHDYARQKGIPIFFQEEGGICPF